MFPIHKQTNHCIGFTKAGITDHFGMKLVLFNLTTIPTVAYCELFKELRD